MKTWEVRTMVPDRSISETFFVITASESHAREWAKRRGLKVESVRELPKGGAPAFAEFHTFNLHAEDPLRTIAESPLIQRPVWTIALGILVGSLLSACVLSMIAAAMGGGVRIGR